MPCCLHLALLLAGIIAAQSTETGLTKLQGDADTRCSEPILTYTCYTAGRGATEVTLNNETVQRLEFSHSRYADGSNVNQSSPDGNINAGNLSRSQTQECSDELANGSASFCFRTVINVRLTDQTRCKTIGCRTRFRIDGVDEFVYYGNAAIARQPPAPRNLRNTTESEGAVTFTWDPGSANCSNARYSVSTSNCGTCGDRNISTTYTNITCLELVPKQQCRIAVQSVLECRVPSEAEILVIEAAAVSTANPATGETVNVGAIIGGVLGGGLALIFSIIVFIIIVGVIIGKRKQERVDLQDAGSTKRSDIDVGSEEARKGTKTSHEGDKQEEEEVVQSREEPPNNKQEALHLHQISSSSNSTAADGDQNALIEAESDLQSDDTKMYTPQSSEESRMEVAEESGGDVNLKSGTTNFMAISQSKPVHSGMLSPRVHLDVIHEDPLQPATATTRGIEPLQFGLRPPLESFSGTLGDDRELEEASETTVAETVYRQDPPKKSYGLSEQGMLLSQANVDEDKEPTTPVPPMDSQVNSPKFAGITQYSNGAGSSQMADFGKRLEQLESDQDEQKKEIKEQRKEIQDLKTSRDESKTKIDELEAEAKKSKLRIDQLSKELKEMQTKHQEEVEKLQQAHQAEKETMKQEMEAKISDLMKKLENETTKNQKLTKELEQEKRKAKNLEKMIKTHESSSEGQLEGGNPKLFSFKSCPA